MLSDWRKDTLPTKKQFPAKETKGEINDSEVLNSDTLYSGVIIVTIVECHLHGLNISSFANL